MFRRSRLERVRALRPLGHQRRRLVHAEDGGVFHSTLRRSRDPFILTEADTSAQQKPVRVLGQSHRVSIHELTIDHASVHLDLIRPRQSKRVRHDLRQRARADARRRRSPTRAPPWRSRRPSALSRAMYRRTSASCSVLKNFSSCTRRTASSTLPLIARVSARPAVKNATASSSAGTKVRARRVERCACGARRLRRARRRVCLFCDGSLESDGVMRRVRTTARARARERDLYRWLWIFPLERRRRS